jgi:hypothetical protein
LVLKEGGKFSKELEQIKGKIAGLQSSVKKDIDTSLRKDIDKNQTVLKFKLNSNKPKREH